MAAARAPDPTACGVGASATRIEKVTTRGTYGLTESAGAATHAETAISPTPTAASSRRRSVIRVAGVERVRPARAARAADPARLAEGLAQVSLVEV